MHVYGWDKKMKLYLMRHGEALPSTTDAQRPLSNEGRLQVESVTKRLQEQEANPKYIYHSGILRAQQTAEIAAQYLQVHTVETIADLLPESAIEPILNQINLWTEDTMLVGHLPYLSDLLSLLSDEGYYVEFDTATVACLEKTSQKW